MAVERSRKAMVDSYEVVIHTPVLYTNVCWSHDRIATDGIDEFRKSLDKNSGLATPRHLADTRLGTCYL